MSEIDVTRVGASEVVVPAPVAPAPTRSESVIDRLREPGVDLTIARARVDQATAAVRRRFVLGGVACVALVGLLVLGSWWIGQRSDDVQSTADRSTTSVLPSTTSTIPEAIPVAPVTTSSTIPAAAGVAPPLEPTSSSPLTARLSVPRSVTVGAPFTLAIDWNDADHAAVGDPSVAVEWNDPFLAAAVVEPPDAACGAGGTPRAGRIERTFRYSTPGTRTIEVRLRSCGGAGPFGEDATVAIPVTVASVAGLPLVAAVDAAAGDPDAAAAVRYPAASGGAETLANRSEAVAQVLRRDSARRATVLIAPDWGSGDVVLLRFPDETCRWAALGGSVADSAAVLTEAGCQPPRPTTTAVPPPTSSTSVPPTAPTTSP